ncbi:uncharacterized protein LOC132729815 [Ruditapes philippinarum]|uniref:uncharacterized protein LOC132729815 n=1 Tax=Ruditapes philippinarum TaxID=129788 RepID=UPI00295BAD75|nr:uncharacterized protein LOC132729815 [Ruditapes philippinarum]
MSRQYFKSSSMFVPYSGSLEPGSMSSLSCEEECSKKSGTCTGVVVTSHGPFCYLALKGYSSRYDLLVNEASAYGILHTVYKAMDICWNNAFQMKYTTMDLLPFIVDDNYFIHRINIPQYVSPSITSPQTIISPGYPFAYHTDFFFMWSINFQNGFVSLQFTDIDLKDKEAFLHSEKGNIFCEENIYLQTEDKLWLSPFGITRDTVNYHADEVFGRMYSFRPFTIDSDYNGKKTNVGSAVEKLKIVFRSCPVEYYKQQPVKGFRTNVLSKVCSAEFKKCYNIKQSNNVESTWTEAFELCKQSDRALVSFGSQREMQFVKEYAARNNRKETTNVYIGLFRYMNAESVINEQWIDGRMLSFTAWEDYQPEEVSSKQCTYMTFTTLRSLSSWRGIDCNQPLSAFVVCEIYYMSENETEIKGEYDVKLNETKDNSSGFISITTGCICHATEMSIAWYYKMGGDNYPFRSMAQQGYFRTYKECHLDCHGLQAAVLSTGFYYSELADGIPVYLHVNLSNSFYKNSIKTIVSNRVYKIKDEIQQKSTFNTYSTWSCGNGEYVSILARCNGYVECSNQQDELDCEGKCNNDHFQCTDGRCIHVSQLCDFTTDCLDGADEYCEGVCSSETSFRCPEGRCLPLSKRCDGYKDCLDGSDEILCESCNSTTAFQCRDKTCILHRLKCDKHKDCGDGSDEETCTEKPFKSCDDVWEEGHTESGLYIIDEMEVKCEFDKKITNMTFLHPDWECFESTPQFQFGKLKIHPIDSVKHAAREGYDCSLKISRVLKRSERIADSSDGAMASATYSATFNQFEFNVNKATVDKSGYIGLWDKNLFFDTASDDFSTWKARIFRDYPFHIHRIICIKDSLRTSPPVFCDVAAESTQHDHVCIYTTDDAWKVGACRSMKHLSNCESFVCGPGFFKCPESYCIPKKFVCDGIKHCNGNEDETECQLCKSITSTRIIAGIDYNDIVGSMEIFSLQNLANVWNSKLVLFQKLPRKNGDNEREFDAYIYDTILTRSRVNCTKHEESCNENILAALNATDVYRELIWVETRSLPLKETPFPGFSSSFNRSWKIVIDASEQYPMKINHGSISEIRVRSMGLFRTIGPDILRGNCTGNSKLFFAPKKCLCIL